MKNTCFAFVSLFAAMGAVAAGQGCSGSSNDAPAGMSPEGGGGGGTAGMFWFTDHDLKKIGIAATDGEEVWSEEIEEAPKEVVVGGGSAWILTDSGNVMRYDQTAHTRTATIAVATKPSYMIFATNAIWVTDDTDGTACNGVDEGPAKLVRVDIATNAVVKKIAVSATESCPANRFVGLASDGTSVFVLVSNDFGIARIDAATNSVSGRLALGGANGSGYLAVSGTDPWVLDTRKRTIQKIDPTSLVVASTTPISAEVFGEYMLGSGDAIYLDASEGALVRIDVKAPATQVLVPVGGSSARAIYKGDYFEGHQNKSLVNTFAFYDAATLARKSGVDDSLVHAVRLAFIP